MRLICDIMLLAIALPMMIGYASRRGRNGNLKLETSDSRVCKINLGTLVESEREEELSMVAMRQF